MSKQPIVELTLYKLDDANKQLDTVGSKIQNVQACDVRVGIESIKDIFSFRVPNKLYSSTGSWSNYLGRKNLGDNAFRIGDFVKIKAYYDTPSANENDNILIYGEITNFNYTDGEEGPSIVINGANITENLLRGFVLSTSIADDVINTVPQIIVDSVIPRLNSPTLPARKKVYAALDTDIITVTGSYGNVVAVKSDGEAFKEVTYSKTWQPAYKILEDLSAPEYTGDESTGNYIFYIKQTPVLPEYVDDPDIKANYINELVFKPATQSTDFVLSRGTDYINNTINKNTDDVTNILIVKPGTDAYGRGMTTYVINTDSLSELGPKYGFWSKPEIANKIKSDEYSIATAAGSPFTAYFPDSYPYTCKTIFERDSALGYLENTAAPKVATDDDSYNDIIRIEMKIRGQIEAQKIVDNLGEPRFGGNVELTTGSNNIGMGTITAIQDDSFGWYNTASDPAYKLRVRDIRHKFDRNGWATSLVVKEDEKVITEKINA